jgi:cytochrome c oxidase cbb3-type subunit 3
MNPPRTRLPVFSSLALSGLLATAILTAAAGDAGNRDAELTTAAANPSVVKQGRELYVALCQQCHGAQGNKTDSPSNLFDEKWYHGSRPSQIEQSILAGIPAKGMPAWGEALPAEDTTAVTAYLLSFQKKAAP